ncbi:DUF397 domain-containing protein [Streptomyces iconiensis]|uniref:DUF397 domain-containing protein n=1 Tax=Streptomyces iconiensis TaxID=1384038 RepID=A0ABT6ZWG2_9ACTN|nr:DUF397 domain-containing protein [Streptomyces iconiensis]MDJ1133411.1 DUF397 domain-containing protein [Streptomyces iconiensis]
MSTHIPAASLSAATWTRSSFSGGNNNCVEVAQLPGGGTAVRDSKALGGPALVVAGPAWRAFLGGARAGDLGA